MTRKRVGRYRPRKKRRKKRCITAVLVIKLARIIAIPSLTPKRTIGQRTVDRPPRWEASGVNAHQITTARKWEEYITYTGCLPSGRSKLWQVKPLICSTDAIIVPLFVPTTIIKFQPGSFFLFLSLSLFVLSDVVRYRARYRDATSHLRRLKFLVGRLRSFNVIKMSRGSM